MKTCSQCHETKRVTEYHACKTFPDGLQYQCKTCQTENNRRRRQADPEAANAKVSHWRKKNPDGWRAIIKRYDAKFPEKRRARARIAKAVYRGKMEKPATCTGCKKEFPRARLHGHHEDYSKPYQIVWLCAKCHTAAEGKTAPRVIPTSQTGGIARA